MGRTARETHKGSVEIISCLPSEGHMHVLVFLYLSPPLSCALPFPGRGAGPAIQHGLSMHLSEWVT